MRCQISDVRYQAGGTKRRATGDGRRIPSATMTKRHPALALTLLLLIGSCGDDDGGGGGSGATIATADYLAFRDQAVACNGDGPEPARGMSFTQPDDLDLGETITATLTTSCGDITIELLTDVAPATLDSFVFLAAHGYFPVT